MAEGRTEKRIMAEKYFDMVYRLALSRTRDTSLADDVTQEVFLRFLREEKPFRGEEHIKAWLLHVTVNCTKKLFSSAWYRRTVPLSCDITFSDPEVNDVYLAVAKLPVKYRTVIHLFYYEDLSISDIAACLGRKESTVKSWLRRGREALKKELGGDAYEF